MKGTATYSPFFLHFLPHSPPPLPGAVGREHQPLQGPRGRLPEPADRRFAHRFRGTLLMFSQRRRSPPTHIYNPPPVTTHLRALRTFSPAGDSKQGGAEKCAFFCIFHFSIYFVVIFGHPLHFYIGFRDVQDCLLFCAFF